LPAKKPGEGHLPRLPIISIIDDDASVRIAAERLARSMDLVAYTFSSCRAFLDSPQLLATSCIVADVQMPGMSGLELQNTLKTMGLAIPLIFITAYPDDKLRKQAMDAGAVCYLHKPFDGAEIIDCIERALGRR
jgi:FixJ family two-component response regulator